jgi:hypothetical protein
MLSGKPSEGQRNDEADGAGGRPPLPAGKRRTGSIKIRVSPRERRRIERRADDLGLSLSAYVRGRALGRPLAPQSVRGLRGLVRSVLVELQRLHEAEGERGKERDAQLTSALGRVEALLDRVDDTRESDARESDAREGDAWEAGRAG